MCEIITFNSPPKVPYHEPRAQMPRVTSTGEKTTRRPSGARSWRGGGNRSSSSRAKSANWSNSPLKITNGGREWIAVGDLAIAVEEETGVGS